MPAPPAGGRLEVRHPVPERAMNRLLVAVVLSALGCHDAETGSIRTGRCGIDSDYALRLGNGSLTLRLADVSRLDLVQR